MLLLICKILELIIRRFILLMCIILELCRVDISIFCLIFSVAVAFIMLSCTFSKSANLPDFVVETWVLGMYKS